MKKIPLIFLLASGFIYADAQSKTRIDNLNLPEIKLQIPPSIFSANQEAKFFKKFESPKEDTLRTLIVNQEEAEDLSSRGRFSHSTANGTVYFLNVDNMPCLVPNMKMVERMTVNKLSKKNIEKMPNAIIMESKIFWL